LNGRNWILPTSASQGPKEGKAIMNRTTISKVTGQRERSFGLSFFLIVSAIILSATQVKAQCTTVLSDLREPIGSVLSDEGNLLIAESGDGDLNSGRISIVDASGNRRTLLDGLPSAASDVGDPSGPTGIIILGRDLYLLIGVGDVGIAGPVPGTDLVNPNGPSSPLFSSILHLHFSAATENRTNGFTLTTENQQALADGETLTLSNGGSDKVRIELVVNFPNYLPAPRVDVPDNIQLSNPFGLVLLQDKFYVSDGGRNLAWEVDTKSRCFSALALFPQIPNPLFPTFGGPFLDAVPTGITASDGELLITLFRGGPFPTGSSSVEKVDICNGSDTTFIGNLTTAIDILPLAQSTSKNYLVLEASSAGPFFAGPGEVLRFDNPAGPPTVIADCLTVPSSMTLDKKTGTLYVTQVDGSLISIPFTN
jgi:hypothetical protein